MSNLNISLIQYFNRSEVLNSEIVVIEYYIHSGEKM